MTGMASGRGRFLLESDTARNQEWLRRRKLRLEQVRKQSNEIAKALRQKIINVEKERLDEYERIGQVKLRDWKAEKLQKLENQLQCALKEFGESYKLAEAEPDPEKVLEERYKINLEKAQKRGKMAMQEELKKKKRQEEKKLSPILRKKLVRKKEDLRSALVHSLPFKKQFIDGQEVYKETYCPEKVTSVQSTKKIHNHNNTISPDSKKKVNVDKTRKKKVPSRRSCLCKHKKISEVCRPKGNEGIWIDLNEIQTSSTGDSGMRARSIKSSESIEKEQKAKPEKIVEFYDFCSRYYCKSHREFPHSVERIEPESEMPNANELAEVEDKKIKEETKKKVVVNAISQERGMEALRREKINQDYNNLITKLEELSRKEKKIKAQQRSRSDILHMNDERLSEKLKMRQRIMNSKFESICYEALSQIPRTQSFHPKVFSRRSGAGDYSGPKESTSTRLSFSPTSSCPKPNSPVDSEEKPTENTSPEGSTRKPKKIKKKRQLLLDIDKTLKEGRELRKTIIRNQTSSEEEEKREKERTSPESQTKSLEPSPKEEKATRTQESQTEELIVDVGKPCLKLFDNTENDSLPLSTSTSYKSPPSVIRSHSLSQFLDYLEGISEGGDSNLNESKTKFHRKLNKLLHDLLDNSKKNSEGKEKDSHLNPTLEYYIKKLLNMSRECIADLSVSSETVSTHNLTDNDIKEPRDAEIQYHCDVSPKGEDHIRKPRLERADHLQETVENWKRILGKNTRFDAKDEPDGPQLVETMIETKEEPLNDFYRTNINNKYEEITKKCSERISELSNMLDRVRKDKEKLLSSTSGGSSSSLREDERNTEKEFGVKDEKDVASPRNVVPLKNLKSSALDDFINKYSVTKPVNNTASTIAMTDSQSFPDCNESAESWPDVMDELLKRNILSSPFKWSDGEYSSGFAAVNDDQMKPSSIETVIGNFRREINKIKPFIVSDSLTPSDAIHMKVRPSFDDNHIKKESFCSPRKTVSGRPMTDGEKLFREENSVESINHALTSLGLNWAKSFLRKNEESRAMSSSSNSEEKSSGDEADFP